MLRAGIDLPPEEEEEHPLFGQRAQAQLKAIELSDVWQGLRAGLEAQREALLAAPLQPHETMRERWGAIQQLSLLLHGGPQMILKHTQMVARPEVDEAPEYVARAHKFEG